MKVGVVVPTIEGREKRLEATLAAYEASCPRGWEFDVVIPEGHATVGAAWNDGASDLDADYLHFGIDDAEPHAGWAEAAVEWSDRMTRTLPAARILQPNGELECCGTMGGGMHLPECETGTKCRSTGLPFLTRAAWTRIGGFLDVHYYVDDDYYWRAAQAGYQVAVVREYAFTHHHTPVRGVVERAMPDMQVFLTAAAGAQTRSAV